MTVCGIGINDVKGSCVKGTYERRVYEVWRSMLMRANDDKYLSKHPTYKGTTVCEEWHRLSAFLGDIKKIEGYNIWLENPNKYIQLDKDIKGNGTKHYCISNCCFVSIDDNIAESYIRNNKKKRIVCINPDGKKKYYSTPMEATKDGFSYSGIMRCLSGQLKRHHKCNFTYA